MAVHQQPIPVPSSDLVYQDDLTGLRNRRFLYQVFGERWREVAGGRLAVAIVDLDYFKQVNDTHGHLTGDLVLAETAGLIERHLSADDFAIRYGGDEFVLLLPDRDKAAAGELAETLRRAMADKEFLSKEERQPLEVVLSFSIGVASFPDDGESGEAIMAAADKALYASKKAGRNCVRLAGELPVDLEDEFDRFRTFPARTLVGRQELIEALGGVCELVNLGTGTWTALHGPAGVGKSRLLLETLRLGLEAGSKCVLVDLSEDAAAQPFAALARLLAAIGHRHPATFQRLLDRGDRALTRFLRTHLPEMVARELGKEEREGDAPDPEATRRALLEALQTLCMGGRWLFLIDDVVHLDRPSAEILREALEVEKLPLAVVSAHRAGDNETPEAPGLQFFQSIARRPWLETMMVAPLSAASTSVLISVLLPNHHAPSDFVDLVFEVTGGNPLFIEEVLRIGIASGRIIRRGGEWFVQSFSAEDVPTSLAEAIGRRISLLDSEVEQAISKASAIGTSFTPGILQALLGKNEGEILDFLDKARAHGLVQGGRFGDSSEVRFSSSSLRDLAYGTLSDADRVRTHREIGKIEEHRAGSLVGALASRLAYHFERGEVYEKARAYLQAAAAAGAPVIVAGSWEESEVPKHRRRRITEAAVPLTTTAWPSVDDVLRALAHATKSVWMYPEGSPIAIQAFQELHSQLGGMFEHAQVLSFAAVEGTLVVNGIPYPARRQGMLVEGLLDRLAARELRGFTIRVGMSENEVAFLVSQLASDAPIERDPEVWERLLAEKRIENVDFDDRVYVPAEDLRAGAEGSTDGKRSSTGVIRLASLASPEKDTSGGFPGTGAGMVSLEGLDLALSAADLRALIEGLEADETLHEEIVDLVPVLVTLLRRLLDSADDKTRFRYERLVEVLAAEKAAEGDGESAGRNPREYLRLLRSERDPVERRGLLEPAERRFESFVEAGDLDSARTVLRFIRQCVALDNGEKDLADEAQSTLERIANGSSVQLLLVDLARTTEEGRQRALSMLHELGAEAGPAMVTALRESNDLRVRRLIARLLREIGGPSHAAALAAVTHGDNPLVARRVVSVLDCLTDNVGYALAQAICVRNPAVLGETIKLLQRQPRSVQLQVIDSLLESASAELVCRGIYYLAEWNLVEGKDKLIELLRHSESPEILMAVTAAVARWRLPGAIPVLGELLGRRHVVRLVPYYPKGLRREFARALAAIGTKEARAVLAEYTRDLDSEIRNIARGMPIPSGA